MYISVVYIRIELLQRLRWPVKVFTLLTMLLADFRLTTEDGFFPLSKLLLNVRIALLLLGNL